MSIPNRRILGSLRSIVADDLSLWQVILLVLWLVSELIHKCSGVAAELFVRWLHSSVEEEFSLQGELADVVAQPETPFSEDEGRVSPEGASKTAGSLIPLLPDEIVSEHVWPMLVRNPTVTQLLHLWHVNSSWSRFVGASLEWRALVSIVLLNTGYRPYVLRQRLRSLSTTQRLGLEIDLFKLLVKESEEEVGSRIKFASVDVSCVPSLGGCPPCVDEDPSGCSL